MRGGPMKRVSIVALIVLPFLLLSCSGKKQEIRNLVTTYNRVLVDAHLRPKPHLMDNFTSEKEFMKIDTYISYLYKTNRVLKSDLKSIDFESIKVEGQKATVVTKERWVYIYLDPVNRNPVSQEYDVLYANKYSLLKKKGRWVVDDLESREIGGKREAFDPGYVKSIHKGGSSNKAP